MAAEGSAAPVDDREAVAMARRAESQIAGEFASTDPSDTWTTTEVFQHVYLPLAGHLLRLCDRLEARVGIS